MILNTVANPRHRLLAAFICRALAIAITIALSPFALVCVVLAAAWEKGRGRI